MYHQLCCGSTKQQDYAAEVNKNHETNLEAFRREQPPLLEPPKGVRYNAGVRMLLHVQRQAAVAFVDSGLYAQSPVAMHGGSVAFEAKLSAGMKHEHALLFGLVRRVSPGGRVSMQTWFSCAVLRRWSNVSLMHRTVRTSSTKML